MSNSIEILHHFSCTSCRGWWSIALEKVMKPRYLYCPWCGHNDYYEVETDEQTDFVGGGVPSKDH
jgi:hypothetical protein